MVYNNIHTCVYYTSTSSWYIMIIMCNHSIFLSFQVPHRHWMALNISSTWRPRCFCRSPGPANMATSAGSQMKLIFIDDDRCRKEDFFCFIMISSLNWPILTEVCWCSCWKVIFVIPFERSLVLRGWWLPYNSEPQTYRGAPSSRTISCFEIY